MRLSSFRESYFPKLKTNPYKVTSSETKRYNCIAWAAGDCTRWWQPSNNPKYYWPSKAPKELTLESFQAAFETLGYERCEKEEAEPEIEKVAIFVDDDGLPSHAARQLQSGNWTSKLGSWEDIEHQYLEDLTGTGSLYGNVGIIMCRHRDPS